MIRPKLPQECHFLPDYPEEWGDDVRSGIFASLTDHEFPIDEAIVVEDPENPPRVKILGSSYIWFNDYGPLTQERFLEEIPGLQDRFVDDVIGMSNGIFQPVRLYKEAYPANGVCPYDFAGDDYPFDVRAYIRYDGFEIQTEDMMQPEILYGLEVNLTTLAVPIEGQDDDLYVGRDIATLYDHLMDEYENEN